MGGPGDWGGGGLGISLEGTVDVEEGVEVPITPLHHYTTTPLHQMRPHHYIRSILPLGPVGEAATFARGDQLLEVWPPIHTHSNTPGKEFKFLEKFGQLCSSPVMPW